MAIAKACFSSLLLTANKANFLLFPLSVILKNNSLQALLCLQAEKEHKNNKFRNFPLPILLIRLFPLTLLPDCFIVGVIPAKLHNFEVFSNLLNPSVSKIKNRAVLCLNPVYSSIKLAVLDALFLLIQVIYPLRI